MDRIRWECKRRIRTVSIRPLLRIDTRFVNSIVLLLLNIEIMKTTILKILLGLCAIFAAHAQTITEDGQHKELAWLTE